MSFFTPERVAAFQAWRRQPTTVLGISGMSGIVTALTLGQVSLLHAAGAATMCVVAMVLNDSSFLPQPIIITQPK